MNCRGLREFEFYSLSGAELDIMPTITSPHFQKVAFARVKPCEYLDHCGIVNPPFWKKLDSSLCELSDWSAHKGPLDVEFRMDAYRQFRGDAWKKAAETHSEERLPKIHGRGGVRVICVQDGVVVYCSSLAG